MGEMLRAFGLALTTMTIIFVLFMVMAEAAKLGLTPRDIVTLVPYVVPGTLPYTVPVSMLFAVTVVYGRLASDNEIIAVKTAGLSAMTVIRPTIFVGAALSATLLYLSHSAIPRANNQARLAVFKNFEDGFYKILSIERELNNPDWPFFIKVENVDIDNRILFNPTFKHRNKKGGKTNSFDLTVQARRAVVKFELDQHRARIFLDGGVIEKPSPEGATEDGRQDDIALVNGRELELPMPDRKNNGLDKRIQEWTTPELGVEQAKNRKLMVEERKRQAITAAMAVGSGRPNTIRWPEVQNAFVNYNYWAKRINEFETEKQFRTAQSFGTLAFVLLGAPVGILFARRDFLSAFISCFVPIILLYYPLMLLGMNMGKEGMIDPRYALWGSNLLLVVIAGFVFPPVIKH